MTVSSFSGDQIFFKFTAQILRLSNSEIRLTVLFRRVNKPLGWNLLDIPSPPPTLTLKEEYT
jgi:hypothetical protein